MTARWLAHAFHKPVGHKPTPDPSQEGNWSTGPAPLLGGVRGGFSRSALDRDRARHGRCRPTPPSVGLSASGRIESSGNSRTFGVVGEAPTTAGEAPAIPINSQP